MFKRLALLAMLCGVVAGCQSTHAPMVTEAPPAGTMDQVGAKVTNDPVAIMEELEAVVTNAPLDAPEEVPAEVTNTPMKTAAESPVAVEETKNDERNKVMILMKTSMGDIKLELDKEKAPKTVENFLSYVDSEHYSGTIFHRVINGFMIQGGGFDESMHQKPAPRTVENEANNGLKNVVGSIAMARTPDPHSASAQFFINVKDNGFLDYPGQDGWGYCVFGKVTEGMDVVNAIKEVPTAGADVPKTTVLIQSVSVIEE